MKPSCQVGPVTWHVGPVMWHVEGCYKNFSIKAICEFRIRVRFLGDFVLVPSHTSLSSSFQIHNIYHLHQPIFFKKKSSTSSHLHLQFKLKIISEFHVKTITCHVHLISFSLDADSCLYPSLFFGSKIFQNIATIIPSIKLSETGIP